MMSVNKNQFHTIYTRFYLYLLKKKHSKKTKKKRFYNNKL